jgi:predicted branched-subunit amino acid permease
MPAAAPTTPLGWFLSGLSHVVTLPVLVLVAAQVGFTTLAREAGFGLGEVVLLTVAVWALPSQVLFVGLVGGGAGLATVVIAVALASVRFLPMTMAWTPVVRTATTPRWLLLLLSWFVAVTAWVFAMARLPDLPREARLPFFAGFAVTLTTSNAAAVAIAYVTVGQFPPVLTAAFVFLTPIYFLYAMFGAARVRADRLAMLFGLAVGPLATVLVPGADILVAGLVAGTAAYLAGRILPPQTR